MCAPRRENPSLECSYQDKADLRNANDLCEKRSGGKIRCIPGERSATNPRVGAHIHKSGNTNRRVRKAAGRLISNKEKTGKHRVDKISTIIRKSQLTYFGHLLREPATEPTKRATFVRNRLPYLGSKRRIGRPRKNWTIQMMKRAWKKTQHEFMTGDEEERTRRFHYNDPLIQGWIEFAATCRLF